MGAALILLMQTALLGALTYDLGHDFTWLSQSARSLLTALAATPIVALLWRRSRRLLPRHVRGAALALSVTAVLVGGLIVAVETGSARMLARWDAGAADRLASRAHLLETDFAGLLQELARPLDNARFDTGGASEAFSLLERARASSRLPAELFGLSVYRAGGEPLAWIGNSILAPAELLTHPGPGPVFRVAGDGEAPRLYALSIDPSTGTRVVAELLLRPPAMSAPSGVDSPLHLGFLPRFKAIQPAEILRGPVPGSVDDMEQLFERQGDRHWWRVGRQRLLTLTLPLRSPDGDELLIAHLSDRRSSEELAARRSVARRAGALLAALGLLLAALQGARGAKLPGWARLLCGATAVVGVRWILLLIGPADALPPLSIYDITVYSSASLGGLLRSPVDLLLTAATALALARMGRALLSMLCPPASRRWRRALRAAACAGLVLLAAAGGLGLHRLLHDLVVESRLDLGRIEFDRHMLPRIALQGGVFLLVAAGATLLLALVDLQRRCRAIVEPQARRAPQEAEERRLPPLLRGAVAVLAMTAIYVPLLQHAYDRLRTDFFESDLMPRVLYQAQGRRSILRDALRTAAGGEFTLAAADAGDEHGRMPAGLAYRLWSRTPLAAMGLASSLRVYDEDGRLLSRFAVNLGMMLEPPFWQAREAASTGPVEVPPRPGVTIKKGVIFASLWIEAPRPRSLIVMTVVDDYDNVPLLGAEAAYLPLLRARALSRTNPELLRYEPQMAVFGPGLERIYESGGEIPAPPQASAEALATRPFVWSVDDVGEGAARILYFSGPSEIYALAYPRRDLIGRLAAYLRLFLQNAALLMAVALFGRVVRGLAGRAPLGISLGGTFYARLTTVFLLTAMAPLLSLAYFVTRISAREYRRELVSTGIHSLQTVRRVAEDYLNLADPEYGEQLDEDVVFWLSRVVRQDINLYRGAGLMATSTPELYGSSLLNTRLDGEVFRSLYLDREPFRLARERVGPLDYLTLSAPMRIDRQGTIGGHLHPPLVAEPGGGPQG